MHGRSPRRVGGLHRSALGHTPRSPRYLRDPDRCAARATVREREHIHHANPDQARGVHRQGESNLRRPVRDVPRGERRLGRDGHGHEEATHPRNGRTPAQRHPPLLPVRDPGMGPREDGRIRPTTDREVGVLAAPPEPVAELLALGGTERPLRRFLLLGVGPLVPEPPLHDRGAVRRCSR